MASIAKHIFAPKSFSMDLRFDFDSFLEALGAVFLVFAALERGLKVNGFLVV